MRVLLSIKPEFAYKIFDGTKKYEFRKTLFKRKDVNKVVVYASNPVKRVIGEFSIADILTDDVESIWKITEQYSGISEKFYNQYFENKDMANAIKVGEVIRYKTPKLLSDFEIEYAPQSFVYL